MLYLASNDEKGLSIFLGLCDENLQQIKLDNPLMAQLSHCGHPGLFFLFMSEDASDSPKMAEARKLLDASPMPYDSFGISAQKLDWIKEGKGVLLVKPGDKLPGVEKIVVLYCNDPTKMAKLLRDNGMVAPSMVVVPKDISEN
jgi:hypothetical protein